MIKLSAFADEVYKNFSNQIKYLLKNKIKYLEIRFVNKKNILDLGKKDVYKVKKILDENDIQISAIASPIGKVKLDEPFEKHLDKFKYAIELAQLLDTKFIRIFSYYPPEGKNIDEYRDEVISRMLRKVELLKDTNLILVHENESHIYGSTAEKCVDLVKSVNSSKFRLVYDPGNFVWGQKISNNIEVCWPIMKPYVAHIHIKDWKLGSKDIGSIPGEGDGQIPELLMELAKMNYNGFITLEPHLKAGGQFGGETGPKLFSYALDSIINLCTKYGLKLN